MTINNCFYFVYENSNKICHFTEYADFSYSHWSLKMFQLVINILSELSQIYLLEIGWHLWQILYSRFCILSHYLTFLNSKSSVINRETLQGTTYKYIQQTSERQISQLYAVKRNSLMALIKFSQLITDFRYFTVWKVSTSDQSGEVY